MTTVLKKLSFGILSIAILALSLAGCSSNEPQGFMPGDTEGIGHGIPAAEPAKEAPRTTDKATPKEAEAGDSTKTDGASLSQGEARNSLGYTPDAEGAQSGQPAAK